MTHVDYAFGANLFYVHKLNSVPRALHMHPNLLHLHVKFVYNQLSYFNQVMMFQMIKLLHHHIISNHVSCYFAFIGWEEL